MIVSTFIITQDTQPYTKSAFTIIQTIENSLTRYRFAYVQTVEKPHQTIFITRVNA